MSFVYTVAAVSKSERFVHLNFSSSLPEKQLLELIIPSDIIDFASLNGLHKRFS